MWDILATDSSEGGGGRSIRQFAGLGEHDCRRSQVLSGPFKSLSPSKDDRAHCSEAAALIWGLLFRWGPGCSERLSEEPGEVKPGPSDRSCDPVAPAGRVPAPDPIAFKLTHQARVCCKGRRRQRCKSLFEKSSFVLFGALVLLVLFWEHTLFLPSASDSSLSRSPLGTARLFRG